MQALKQQEITQIAIDDYKCSPDKLVEFDGGGRMYDDVDGFLESLCLILGHTQTRSQDITTDGVHLPVEIRLNCSERVEHLKIKSMHFIVYISIYIKTKYCLAVLSYRPSDII